LHINCICRLTSSHTTCSAGGGGGLPLSSHNIIYWTSAALPVRVIHQQLKYVSVILWFAHTCHLSPPAHIDQPAKTRCPNTAGRGVDTSSAKNGVFCPWTAIFDAFLGEYKNKNKTKSQIQIMISCDTGGRRVRAQLRVYDGRSRYVNASLWRQRFVFTISVLHTYIGITIIIIMLIFFLSFVIIIGSADGTERKRT